MMDSAKPRLRKSMASEPPINPIPTIQIFINSLLSGF
jgi:hypothetical protein